MHDRIIGRTVRWSFRDGPTKGKRFEHTFHRDGTVDYGEVDRPAGHAHYEIEEVAPAAVAVSYLGKAGYTLTTVLDLGSGRCVAFASNEDQLVVQHGTFEVQGTAPPRPAQRVPRLGQRPTAHARH